MGDKNTGRHSVEESANMTIYRLKELCRKEIIEAYRPHNWPFMLDLTERYKRLE